MGCKKKVIEGALRLSFAKPLSDEEQNTLVSALKKEVDMIRRYM